MEPEEIPLQRNTERTRVPETPVEPRTNSNEELLNRRIAELEAQLRIASVQSLHGSRAQASWVRVPLGAPKLFLGNSLGDTQLILFGIQQGCLNLGVGV